VKSFPFSVKSCRAELNVNVHVSVVCWIIVGKVGESFGRLCAGCNSQSVHLENREKSGNLTLVREKSEKLEKVREIVVCLWCAMNKQPGNYVCYRQPLPFPR